MTKSVKVLAFDVFGTVVDWHGSIADEAKRIALPVDVHDFANAWRAGYKPAMDKVMSGKLPWTRIDDLHRRILDGVLIDFSIKGLSEAELVDLNLVWHRLNPWSDTIEGLTRLKSNYTICTLSNGNIGLLTNMAKNAQLPWDCILSAEIFKAYKPDPRTYLGVCDVFDIKPEQALMVAAHQSDLVAARENGLKTAYVERPFEFGTHLPKDISPDPENTFHCRDFIDLADQLGC